MEEAKVCAENRHHQENKRIQKGVHKYWYQQSPANGSGAKRGVEMRCLGHGTVPERELAKTSGQCSRKEAASLALFVPAS